ncbi:hypothetical protein ACOSQ3_020512 [Xanthoceras sorbifolium]
MSIKKIPSLKDGGSASMKKQTSSKRRRLNTCFSFQEISIQRSPGKSLKDTDSDELKAKIVRWAKAVVAYARQVSGKFGSSRRIDDDNNNSKSAGSWSRVHEDSNKNQQLAG